jgi:hypothetical protein
MSTGIEPAICRLTQRVVLTVNANHVIQCNGF